MSGRTPADVLVKRILEGSAPLNLRSAAARGAVPLSRTQLARIFVSLISDDEERVRRDAEASLKRLAEDKDEIRAVLSDETCAPEVLSHFARMSARDGSLAELIVFHKQSPAEALELFAGQGNAEVIELVLTNQERLLEQPRLLDRLSVNPALRADQRGRILELLGRSAKRLDEQAPEGTEEHADDAETAARLLDVDVGDLFAASEILDGEEFEQDENPEIRSAYRKILTLNTAQKAILAMKGGREERLILVRDTNKVVSLAVLKNPRLSDGEIEHIAHARNVSDEVLRTIGNNRDWSKSYTVVTALVRNPRTPPGVATNFVSRLMNRDLKALVRDHNAPELVRRMAKRIHDTRTQPKRTLGKKR